MTTLVEGQRANLIGPHELLWTLDVTSDELAVIQEAVDTPPAV